MDTVAYYAALLFVILVPQTLLFWFFVHPFARHWRKLRLSPAKYLGLVTVYLFGSAAAIFPFREPLLRVSFGASVPLAIAGGLLFLAAMCIRVPMRRQLSISAMMGVPEVSADDPGKLLTEGIYAKIRHPRYVELCLGLLGWALFCNYLAVYVLLALSFPAFFVIVLLEERELKERFGGEYEEYARRVPRFVPRLRKGGS